MRMKLYDYLKLYVLRERKQFNLPVEGFKISVKKDKTFLRYKDSMERVYLKDVETTGATYEIFRSKDLRKWDFFRPGENNYIIRLTVKNATTKKL